MTKVKDTNNQDDKLNLDEILVTEIGEGNYQVQAFVLFGFIAFFYGLTLNDFIFIAERIKTRCKIQECEDKGQSNFSPSWLGNAVPTFGDAFDNCHRFASSDSWNISADSCPATMFDRSTTLKCTDYVYQHQNSAVYEFDLACDEWGWFLFGGLPLLGMMISLTMTGFVSDRWGRRFALSITAFNLAWINIFRYWASSYALFIFIGFLGSVFGAACMSCCGTLAMELVAPSRRMLAVSILTSCSGLGAVMQGLIAWTQPYWRDLILMMYLPMLTSISYLWIGPESVRWLMTKNRFQDAKTLLLKAAKMNGRVLTSTTLKKITEDASLSKSKLSDGGASFMFLVWRHKIMLTHCIIICIWLMSSAFMLKGLVISSVSISGNKYVNYCTVSAISIPGFWIATFLNDKIGRKRFLFALFLMGGSFQMGYIFISNGSQWIQLVLYLLSQFCTSAIQTTLAVYKTELFPTSHRSRLVGFTATFARFGGLTAMLAPALADRVWERLPNAIFSFLAFVSGLLTLLTPETLGATLPATIADAARLGKDELNAVRNQLGRILCRMKADRRHVDDDDVELEKLI